jgi:hypothetical protein
MKNLFVAVTCLLIWCSLFVKTASAGTALDSLPKADHSTSDTLSNKNMVRAAADLKSGTSQDVLFSFFNLAYKDLYKGRQFQFNSSLFAIRAKSDSLLWIDTNYRKYKFARNFVVGVGLGLDSSFNFKSASVNLKYAIINKRDDNIFNFSYLGPHFDTILSKSNRLFSKAADIYFKENPEKIKTERSLIANYYNYKSKSVKTKKEDVPKRYLAILDSLMKDKEFEAIKDFKTDNLRDSLKNIAKTISDLISQKSLWTIGSQLTAGSQKFSNRANLNTEYLKGITKSNTSMGLELDLKGNLDIYDTTAVTISYSRRVLSGSAGINWILWKDKSTQKSHIEFKPALAYNNVLSGMLPGETKSKFTGDGVLRFRITDDLWIPIDIKYDPQAGKFFGFLNITSNFDWLGAKPKSSANN